MATTLTSPGWYVGMTYPVLRVTLTTDSGNDNVNGLVGSNFAVVIRNTQSLMVNTNSSTTIAPGVQAVTPVSMANIAVGSELTFTGGAGASETIIVQSVTSTTFTATFVNSHSGAYAITSSDLVGQGSFVVISSNVITYQFAAADVIMAGPYMLYFKATFPSGTTVYDPVAITLNPS